MNKTLVAHFSASGATAYVAKELAQAAGADLYEIRPAVPYTKADLNWMDKKACSSVEMNNSSSRPALADKGSLIAAYDTILLGFPIWWGEAPRIMRTFVESYDFSGKTLAPFCTSASSGFGSSDSALRSAAGKATWLDGHRFSASASAKDVLVWANGLEIN